MTSGGLFRYRLNEAIAEIERELQVRASFYPRAVSTGRMSRFRADSQRGRLEAARDFLIELRETRGGDYERNEPRSGGTVAGR